MLDESPLFGFDAAADGTLTVVQMRRTAAGWHVEQMCGPDHPDLSRVVARIVGEHPPPPSGERSTVEVVDEWMAAHGDITLGITDEQRDVLVDTLKRHVAEGTVRLHL